MANGMRLESGQIREMPLHMQEQVALYFVKPCGGTAVAPLIPGPRQDSPDMLELAFHNGETHMKEKVLAHLMDQKTKVKGLCHACVVDMIRMVESL